MYRIEFTKTAIKRLRRLPRNLVERIDKKLQALAVDPYGPQSNVKKLSGRPGYRLRVGDWRILYEVNDDTVTILVLDIDTRGGIYQ